MFSLFKHIMKIPNDYSILLLVIFCFGVLSLNHTLCIDVFHTDTRFIWQDRVVKLFETNTYSVVNVFDVTLRPQLNAAGVVEV